jgi:enoyl-CoA hydratase/carnithine racemase
MPRAIALEYIATGAPITPGRAYELGMVNRVTPTGGAVAEALRLAEAIGENSPYCVRESLKLARISVDHDVAQMWRKCEAARDGLTATEDYREGPRAFAEKRKPNWTGR